MDRTDLLNGFPAPPPERQLPHHGQQREELLAVVRATEPGDRWAAQHRRHPWLVPLAAAAAVLAIVIPLSLAGSHLLQSSPGGPATGGKGPATEHPGGTNLQTSTTTASFSHGRWHRTDTVTASGQVGSLVVNAGVGNVTVTGTSASTVSVTERISYRDIAPRIGDNLTGNRLSLGYSCSGECGVSYTIDVPRGMTVTAHADTGAIRLSGLAGPVVASTNTGSVTATDLSSASANLTAKVGSITAAFSATPRAVRAVTDTGSITVRVPASGTYAVSASSDIGTVRVTVPRAQSSAHAITARTDVGSVTIAGS